MLGNSAKLLLAPVRAEFAAAEPEGELSAAAAAGLGCDHHTAVKPNKTCAG